MAYMYRCQFCKHVERREVAESFIPRCPCCPTGSLYRKKIKATVTEHECNDECRYAIGPICKCSCGGAHHGEGHMPGKCEDLATD